MNVLLRLSLVDWCALAASITALTVLATWRSSIARFLRDLNASSSQSQSTGKPSGNFAFLECLRVISLFAVMAGHLRQILSNFYDTAPEKESGGYSLVSLIVIQAMNLSVETFLVIGGLLHAHSWLRKSSSLPSNDPEPIWKIASNLAIQRWLRLGPSLMAVVGISLIWSHYVPPQLWMGSQDQTLSCSSTWWSMGLFLNNYIPNSCLRWTWYLALDFQLYLAAPLLLSMGGKLSTQKFLLISAALIGFSSVWRIGIASWYGISTLYTSDAPVWEPAMQWIYVKPLSRAGPYIIGLFLGYHRVRICRLFQDSKLKSVSQTLSAVLASWAFFGGMADPWTGQLHRLLYIGVFRHVFAVSIALLILSCFTSEETGTLNALMSAPFWRKISKYSFGSYLIHPLLAGLFLYSSNLLRLELRRLNVDVLLAILFPTVALASWCLASVLNRCVEEPAMKLRRYLVK